MGADLKERLRISPVPVRSIACRFNSILLRNFPDPRTLPPSQVRSVFPPFVIIRPSSTAAVLPHYLCLPSPSGRKWFSRHELRNTLKFTANLAFHLYSRQPTAEPRALIRGEEPNVDTLTHHAAPTRGSFALQAHPPLFATPFNLARSFFSYFSSRLPYSCPFFFRLYFPFLASSISPLCPFLSLFFVLRSFYFFLASIPDPFVAPGFLSNRVPGFW